MATGIRQQAKVSSKGHEEDAMIANKALQGLNMNRFQICASRDSVMALFNVKKLMSGETKNHGLFARRLNNFNSYLY